MRKIVLFTLCCLCANQLFAINPLLRGLRKLNKSAFKTPLNATLTRQTFTQLQASEQLAQFSQAECALLLTHQFTKEFNHWPRTKIARNGQLIDPAQYTTEEMAETKLGNLLRTTLENNPQTPPLIREELENLKTAYAPQRKHIFVLEQLNGWLSAHPWPRETIPHEGRALTEEEEYEITLAKETNKILTVPLNAIPRDLVKQLRSIREMYDPTYYTPETKTQDSPYQLLEETYAWLNEYHRWPLQTDMQSREKKLAMAIEQALKKDIAQHPALLQLSNLKNTYYPLTLNTKNITTPVPTRTEHIYFTPLSGLGNTPIEAKGGFSTQQEVWPSFLLQEENYAVLLKLIDWLKENHTWPHIYSATGNKREIQLAKNVQELANKYFQPLFSIRKQWEKYPLSFELATTTAPQELLKELDDWLFHHERWPEERIIRFEGQLPVFVPEEEYTPEQIEESSLAKRVLAFAAYASELEQGKWKKEPNEHPHFLLQLPSSFGNPDLELLRKLYRYYNDYY